MPIFSIETATTGVSRERRAGRVCERPTLEVEGPAAEGGRNRARFVFGRPRPATAVGYLTACGPDRVSLVGWLPAAAFAAFRDAATGGGSLQVHYETRDGSSGYLRRLGLGRAGSALFAATSLRPRRTEASGAGFAMPL